MVKQALNCLSCSATILEYCNQNIFMILSNDAILARFVSRVPDHLRFAFWNEMTTICAEWRYRIKKKRFKTYNSY